MENKGNYELSNEAYDMLSYISELVSKKNEFEALVISLYKLDGEDVTIMEARIVSYDSIVARKFINENEDIALKMKNILGHNFSFEVENIENLKYGVMKNTNRRAAKDVISGDIIFDRNGKVTKFAEQVATKLMVRPYENVYKIKMPENLVKIKK